MGLYLPEQKDFAAVECLQVQMRSFQLGVEEKWLLVELGAVPVVQQKELSVVEMCNSNLRWVGWKEQRKMLSGLDFAVIGALCQYLERCYLQHLAGVRSGYLY